jgi:uncharacterized protein YggE
MAWSSEESQQVVTGYRAGKSVELLAKELNKTTRSIIMKLVNMGVYTSQAKKFGALSKPKGADLEDFHKYYKLCGAAML